MFLLLLPFSIAAQQQWEWVNPKPQGNNLNAISLDQNGVYWAAGDCGTMLKSTDGGLNWELIQTGTRSNLQAIWVGDDGLAIAVGSKGSIIRSTNGGQTWEEVLHGYYPQLNDIKSIGTDTLIVAGDEGFILKSYNAGQDWHEVLSPTPVNLKSIAFTSPKVGYIAGDGRPLSDKGHIFMTDDGGENWVLLTGNLKEGLYAITFFDQFHGVAAGNFSYVVVTYDGGQSWAEASHPNSGFGMHIISLSKGSDQKVYACGVGGYISQSTNGGASWSIIWEEKRLLTAIDVTLDGKVMAVGSGGNILTSTDAGATFTNQQKVPAGDMVSINRFNNHLIAVSNRGFFKSTDLGRNWTYKATEHFNYCYDAQFTDPLNGFVLVYDGVFVTNDGGDSWTKTHFANRAYWMSDLYMISPTHGYAVGGGQSPGGITWASVYRTTNGTNWETVNIPYGRAINKVKFFGSEKGIMLSGNSKLLISTNGGQTWAVQNIHPVSYGLIDLCFIDETNIFIIGRGYNNVLFKSADGGQTWILVYEWEIDYSDGWASNTLSIDFYDPLHGFITLSNGNLYITSDGGQSWQTLQSITNNPLGKFQPVKADAGFAIGYEGTILSYGIAGAGLDPEYQPSFKVSPNPFSSEILIELLENDNSDLHLSLFNLMGMCVDEVSIDHNKSGNFIRYLPPHHLSTGTYLLRIVSSHGAFTCKLVKATN